MTTKLEQAAIKQALDDIGDAVNKALATIREALDHSGEATEMVQEPVATLGVIHPDWFEEVCEKCNGNSNTPLYVAPVRTKDLTDDELNTLWHNTKGGWLGLFRAVIAADRELNK